MAGLNTLLHATCLKPKYRLQRQFMVSYGCTAVLTIAVVILLAVVATVHSGHVVTKESENLLHQQVQSFIQDSAHYTADILTQQLVSVRGTAALMVELVRDRIVGYPNRGFENDAFVPFLDFESQRNKYPLQSTLLPRDWQIPLNLRGLDLAALQEHTQERALYYLNHYQNYASTASADFFFQGNCDPAVTDPTNYAFFPNCTEENNNVTSGGVVQPVRTTRWIAEKAADLAIYLKPLWESEPMAISLSLQFANSGAGAISRFPGFFRNYTRNYTSLGCEWMKTTPNPYTPSPSNLTNSSEEISRCHPAGEVVSLREENPLERPMCQEYAKLPGETSFLGPLWDDEFQEWRLYVGEAIFDRM